MVGYLLLAALVFLYIFIYRSYWGKPQSITLLPYQRGVLFVRGVPTRDLGSGKHRVRVGTEFLVYLDTRPIAVRVENQAVVLQDGATAVYAFSASAEVKDVRKAIYSSRNYNQVPPYLVRRSTRKVLSSNSSTTLMTASSTIERAITTDVEPRLAEAGFALSSFRLRQLSVSPCPETSVPVNDSLAENRLVN